MRSWWWRRSRELPLADHDLTAPGGLGGRLDASLLTALRRLSPRQADTTGRVGNMIVASALPGNVGVQLAATTTLGAILTPQVVYASPQRTGG